MINICLSVYNFFTYSISCVLKHTSCLALNTLFKKQRYEFRRVNYSGINVKDSGCIL